MRHVFQRQRLVGQQRGDHQRQGGVLRAGNRNACRCSSLPPTILMRSMWSRFPPANPGPVVRRSRRLDDRAAARSRNGRFSAYRRPVVDAAFTCPFVVVRSAPAALPAARRPRPRGARAPAPCASAGWRAARSASRALRVVLPGARLRWSSAWRFPSAAGSVADGITAASRAVATAMCSLSRCGSKSRRRACALPDSYGRRPPHPASCGSSVVEHSLGKGEVESSILSRSTSFPHHKRPIALHAVVSTCVEQHCRYIY